jgi:hypothetical protein
MVAINEASATPGPLTAARYAAALREFPPPAPRSTTRLAACVQVQFSANSFRQANLNANDSAVIDVHMAYAAYSSKDLVLADLGWSLGTAMYDDQAQRVAPLARAVADYCDAVLGGISAGS